MPEQKFGLAEADALDFPPGRWRCFADSDFVVTRHDSRSNYLLELRGKVRSGRVEFACPTGASLVLRSESHRSEAGMRVRHIRQSPL